MKRRSKYLMAIMAGVCIMAFSGCASDSVKVKENQKLVYGEVEKIVGNEVILSRSYESTEEDMEAAQNSLNSSTESSSGNSSEAASESIEQQSESSINQESEMSSEMSLETSSEEVNVVTVLQLPVGMPIHKGKEEISFMEIQEGDPLKILMEKDESGIEVPIEAWVAELTKKEEKELEKRETATVVPTESAQQSTAPSETSSDAVETMPSSETSSLESMSAAN